MLHRKRQRLGDCSIARIVEAVDISESLSVRVHDLEAAVQSLRRSMVEEIVVHSYRETSVKGAPTEADAPPDNEGPATTYFISDGPGTSLVPATTTSRRILGSL